MQRSTVRQNKNPRENHAGVAWHALTPEKVLQKLRAAPDGLTTDQIAERQQEFGRNILPAHEPPKLWQVARHQFRSPLIYILLAAGVVSVTLGNFKDAAFILAVVLLNAAIGTYQEWKAEQSASALQTSSK